MRDVPLFRFRYFRRRAKIITSGLNVSQDEVESEVTAKRSSLSQLANDNLSINRGQSSLVWCALNDERAAACSAKLWLDAESWVRRA